MTNSALINNALYFACKERKVQIYDEIPNLKNAGKSYFRGCVAFSDFYDPLMTVTFSTAQLKSEEIPASKSS